MTVPRPNPARDALVGALKALGILVDNSTAGHAMRELRLRGWRLGRMSRRRHEEYLEYEKQKGRAVD